MQDYKDDELVEMLRAKGKDYAFRFIVTKYKESLYWLIRKMTLNHEDTDDVLQNTFLKAWKGLDNFKAESKLYTWLYRISTNETISFLNKKKRNTILPIDIKDELINKLESDTYFCGDEMQLKLQKAILQLPDKQRLVFNMKYFEEIKYSKMAEILDTSEGALKASYHHAVKKIEEYLKSEN
jgi:RNA polymerase sigma factor (sigma-70 family)